MKHLTFGVASSPFLATQVLRRLAKDHYNDFPRASNVLSYSFYLDDCLTGAETVKEAIFLQHELLPTSYESSNHSKSGEAVLLRC